MSLKSKSEEKHDNKVKKPGIFRRFLNFLAIFLPGIRTKLAVFIGILISLTIFIFSLVNLQQQDKILSESYDREAAISRKYISSLVLELDNISENLIRIEQFRERVTKQRKALKKYQTVRTYTYKKKVSVLGVKTNLFGAAGSGRIRRNLDTYYSAYLSDNDMKQIEMRTRALLQPPGEPPISDNDFNKLTKLAGAFVKANSIVEDIREKISDKDEGPETDKLKKSLERYSLYAQKRRIMLDQQITALLSLSRKKKIIELGLDTSRFRIQTFSAGALLSGETTIPTMDTSIYNPDKPLNQQIDEWILKADLERAIVTMMESPDIQNDISPLEVNFNGMDLQVLYSPHFRNPSSSIRLQKLAVYFRKVAKDKKMEEFLEKDAVICQRLSDISALISEKLVKLREKKPPKPPGKDVEFKELYQKYDDLLKERYSLYEELEKNKSNTLNLELIDAAGYIRDAALEDTILIHFANSPASYEEYFASEDIRKYRRQRWYEIRNWIYSGMSETPPESLKRRFNESMIGFSRTEAEGIMWKLDAMPIKSDEKENVFDFVNDANFAGVIRTLVDRTAGIRAIQTNKNRTLLYAQIITAVAIVLTFFLSGMVVKKIKIIIKSAEDVGKGNLNIQFAKGGWDEFGDLSRALNQMVNGLHEREKIKGILGSMVDPVVIGEAMKDLQALKNGTEKKVTAFFSDIAGFSSISEKLSSIELASLLNEYLSAMTIILKEHEGVLDKYIGDAIVGIFNAPVDVENYTLKAVKASLRMIEKMEELKSGWRSDNKYIPEAREMHFRIGLNTGMAKVGFMGTDDLASYTMMGDSVNLASRLEAAGKDYGVAILASQNIYDEVKSEIYARKLDLIRVKGKKEPVVIYEIISDAETKSIARGIKDSKKLYEEGLDFYLKREWGKAIQSFQESEKIRGREDKAVKILIDRIEHYRKSPPPEDWDGSYAREHK